MDENHARQRPGRGRGRGRGQRVHDRPHIQGNSDNAGAYHDNDGFGDQEQGRYHPRGNENNQHRGYDGEGNWRQNNGGNRGIIDGNRNPRGGGRGGGRGGARHRANAPEFQIDRRPRDRSNHQDGNWRCDNRQNNGNRNNNPQRTHQMGFRALEEMSQTDAKDIILKINEKKIGFMKILESTIDSPDIFVLIMKLLAKVCESPFDQLKLKLLLEVCDSRFLSTFLNYLMGLPYTEVKARNKLYWNNQQEFWENFIMFCESILNLSPSTALRTCRTLIEGSSKCILELLHQRHGFQLPEELDAKLKQLRDRLSHCEEDEKVNLGKKRRCYGEDFAGMEPPDNFRVLSVVPTRDDLMDPRPFVRPNIVEGSYRDVEHYLDVQFRLLREDCFGPLRDGIAQFIENSNRKKFDNIRVYRNVKLVENYISKTKIGLVIKLDDKNINYFRRVNWAHSKRFIFGSLLLFSSDNCASFIAATIVDREPKLLVKGMIPISVVDNMGLGQNLCNDVSYVMIESEVYFEPYFHVLKALQDPTFPQHLAMNKYIVHVDPVPQNPAYLQQGQSFVVETKYSPKTKFDVLDPVSWPTKEDLGLNNSQYEAYRLALTHEFAVIQGPPGTGKTFLGIKVAKTLLQNVTPRNEDCLMLMICYTNHALDQFLEAMIPLTKSIVRIGGQSRNEAMDKINLATLRKKTKVDGTAHRLFYEQLNNLKLAVSGLKHAQARVDHLSNGILSYNCLRAMVPESEFLGKFYANYKEDPLKLWLFQAHVNYHGNFDFEALLGEQETREVPQNIADQDDRLRTDAIMDDLEIEEDLDVDMLSDMSIKTTFSIDDAEKKLAALVMLYKKTFHMPKKYQIEQNIFDLKSRMDLFKDMDMIRNRTTELVVNRQTNFGRMSNEQRWLLYFRWANIVLNEIKRKMRPLQDEFQRANTAYEEARMLSDMQLLRGIKVVGMTTSGAARLRKLLMALAPQIVIVEEAAEVLEQHIVTSLTSHCRHLILIGDHQQLRPSAAHMKLARHFNLEISLFERMITNGIHSRRLGVQHRMRPELAALICPHVYPELENHPSVEHFPAVRGMTDNLFFFTHDYKEEEVDDSSSRCNHLEGDMTLKLANYIMQQGYNAEDVTILAAYSGQMFYMRKQRDQYKFLSKVKITVVDNYQGEESKIILLSLVRNNNQNKIGFLGTENRVCVALSRAREGFYILGNIDILKRNSELWNKIAQTLEEKGSLGSMLMLRCENHSDSITTIQSSEDFGKVPEGGCLLKCNFNLPCGHRCPLICHGYDRSHVQTLCLLPCERTLCELKHVCPLICSKECQPCEQPVLKTLPCGHDKTVPCHKEPGDPTIHCLKPITVQLPSCKHEAQKPCYQRIETVRCLVPCVYRVDKCGHGCLRNCHVKDDPDHERYLCGKPCSRSKKGCSLGNTLTDNRGDHQCPKRCHETCDDCTVEVKKKRITCTHYEKVACNLDVNEKPCRKNCARRLECGHFCKKKCFEQCGDCRQKVKKTVPGCNHVVEVMCMETVTRAMCNQKCERMLSCGHPCTGTCAQECDSSLCMEVTSPKHNSPCGHLVQLPCNVYRRGDIAPDMLLKHCMERCNEMLACDHYCEGTCSQCHQQRLHVACKGPCDRPNICGHLCKQPCNQACPPCNMPCEIKCRHSRCSRRCGAPCVPCQEPCTRVCRHGRCTNRCGQPCNRDPCDEPCDKIQTCGHPCRGLCGEPCPGLCKICRPEDFPSLDVVTGDEYDDDAKFVKLEDCTHVESVENMDILMKGDSETIEIKYCHFCRKPVINTHRYKNLINEMYDKGINAVKEKVYGNAKQITEKRKDLIQLVLDITEKVHNGHPIENNKYWKQAFHQIKFEFASRRRVSLPQLEIQLQYLNILLMIADNYAEYIDTTATPQKGLLKDKILDLVQLLCSVLMQNSKNISQQLQLDIRNELKRMNGIIQLSKTMNHQSYLSLKTAEKVKAAAKNAEASVLTWKKYDHKEADKAIKELQDSVKVFITKEERDLIIKAIGSKAGSWYKCPNGHIYGIDQCGGAMQIGKCADCGAAIGGTSHRLLATNSHAGDVDGSRQSAWPGAAMNMDNYQL